MYNFIEEDGRWVVEPSFSLRGCFDNVRPEGPASGFDLEIQISYPKPDGLLFKDGKGVLRDGSIVPQPQRFTFDTGATRSIISTALAKELGFPRQRGIDRVPTQMLRLANGGEANFYVGTLAIFIDYSWIPIEAASPCIGEGDAECSRNLLGMGGLGKGSLFALSDRAVEFFAKREP